MKVIKTDPVGHIAIAHHDSTVQVLVVSGYGPSAFVVLSPTQTRALRKALIEDSKIRNPTRFDGGIDPQGVKGYDPFYDDARLTGQLLRVIEAMMDSEWRTLEEIGRMTNDPHASISAQLRHLRKPRFGSHVVEKQSRGDREDGLWEYRLIWNDERLRP